VGRRGNRFGGITNKQHRAKGAKLGKTKVSGWHGRKKEGTMKKIRGTPEQLTIVHTVWEKKGGRRWENFRGEGHSRTE